MVASKIGDVGTDAPTGALVDEGHFWQDGTPRSLATRRLAVVTIQDARNAIEAVCNAGASHLKVEFEAEGATSAEASLLATLADEANLELVVKVGGCEAVRDIRETLQLGAESVVAPMIESPFAASKFVRAVTVEADLQGMKLPQLAINIESVAGVAALPEIANAPVAKKIERLVLGRTDLTDSLGLSRGHVEDSAVRDLAIQTFQIARRLGISTTLGGTITLRSVPFIQSLSALIDSVETRKVVFPIGRTSDLSAAIAAAVHFELAWLDLKSRELAPLTAAEAKRRADLGVRLATT